MQTLVTVLTIVQLVVAVALTLIVLFQSGKSAGLSGAIAGSSESFMSKGKSRTMDAKLARATKWVAAVFVVLTLAVTILINYTFSAPVGIA